MPLLLSAATLPALQVLNPPAFSSILQYRFLPLSSLSTFPSPAKSFQYLKCPHLCLMNKNKTVILPAPLSFLSSACQELSTPVVAASFPPAHSVISTPLHLHHQAYQGSLHCKTPGPLLIYFFTSPCLMLLFTSSYCSLQPVEFSFYLSGYSFSFLSSSPTSHSFPLGFCTGAPSFLNLHAFPGWLQPLPWGFSYPLFGCDS